MREGGKYTIAFGTEILNITKDLIVRGASISNSTLTSDRRQPVRRVRSSSRRCNGTGGGSARDEEEEAESHEKGKDRKSRHDEVPSTKRRSKRVWNLSTAEFGQPVYLAVG